jgi:hypothetical protein
VKRDYLELIQPACLAISIVAAVAIGAAGAMSHKAPPCEVTISFGGSSIQLDCKVLTK